MKRIAKQALWFTSAALLLDLALEAVTVELPFSHDLRAWKQKLVVHLLIVVAVAFCALVGGSIGFYFLPKNRDLRVRQLVWIGASFVAVAFATSDLLAGGGLVGLLLGLTVIALIVVQSVGRWMSRRGA